MSKYLRRREIWLAECGPVVGHEQDGRRPVLIMSSDRFNAGPDEMVAIVPLTKMDKPAITQVPISARESGLRHDSFILPEQLRCVSQARLVLRIGEAPESIVREVEYHIGMMLQLPVEEPDLLD